MNLFLLMFWTTASFRRYRIAFQSNLKNAARNDRKHLVERTTSTLYVNPAESCVSHWWPSTRNSSKNHTALINTIMVGKCFTQQFFVLHSLVCSLTYKYQMINTECSFNTNRSWLYSISQTQVSSKFHKVHVAFLAFHTYKINQKTLCVIRTCSFRQVDQCLLQMRLR